MKEVYVVIEVQPYDGFKVSVDGVNIALYLSESKVTELVEDIKRMNRDKKVTVLTGEGVHFNRCQCKTSD